NAFGCTCPYRSNLYRNPLLQYLEPTDERFISIPGRPPDSPVFQRETVKAFCCHGYRRHDADVVRRRFTERVRHSWHPCRTLCGEPPESVPFLFMPVKVLARQSIAIQQSTPANLQLALRGIRKFR